MRSVLRSLSIVVFAALLVHATTAAAGARRRSVRSGTPRSTLSSPTTFGVIDRALAEGRITADQAIVYKVYATYDDSRLPQEFLGDDSEVTDTLYMTEVASQFETLSESVREQVAPFLIPPFHDHSWWQLRHNAGAQSFTPRIFERPCPITTCGLSFDWEFVPTSNGKVKVWYHEGEPLDAQTARAFAEEIDNVIWPKLTALMGREPLPDEGSAWLGTDLGGDSRLDIALTDVSRSITTGRFVDCSSGAWAQIQLNRDATRTELAHELMHAFQYAFRISMRGPKCTGENEYRWLMEATGEWAKDFVYPDATVQNEHWAAKHLLKTPDVPLDLRQELHWYGAYLFPFFLSRVKGQTQIVGTIWKNTEGASSLDAIEQALGPLGGFEKVWPEFAVYNWNQEPVNRYEVVDGLSDHPAETGDTFLASGAVDRYAPLNAELEHLSANYKHFVFNSSVRSVAFLNGLTFKLYTMPKALGPLDLGQQYTWQDVPVEQKKGAAVWAIVKKGGKWQKEEDWTNVPFKSFCRHNPDENIEEIVLIFSNSNKDAASVLHPPDQRPLLIATDMACAWDGTLTWNGNDVVRSVWGDITVTYNVTREPKDPMVSKDYFLGYAYDITGHASWNVSGSIGACTTSGSNANAAIHTDRANFTVNFAPQGSLRYRKAYFPTSLQDTIKFTLRCPDGSGQVDAGILGYGFPFPDVLMFLSVESGHLKGEAPDPNGLWKWDFKPKE